MVANNIEELTAVDESDGIEIDDYDMFRDMSSTVSIMVLLLQPGQTWTCSGEQRYQSAVSGDCYRQSAGRPAHQRS